MGFLIREDIAFSVRFDLEENTVEAQWIEIHRDKLPSIICCSVYIPPHDNRALEELERVFQKTRQKHRLFLLLGDFNARSKVFGDETLSQNISSLRT